MDARSRMTALMEGRQVPPLHPNQDATAAFQDFGTLQTDNIAYPIQADRVSNPRFNAPGAVNGSERMMTIQVPISIGMA